MDFHDEADLKVSSGIVELLIGLDYDLVGFAYIFSICSQTPTNLAFYFKNISGVVYEGDDMANFCPDHSSSLIQRTKFTLKKVKSTTISFKSYWR